MKLRSLLRVVASAVAAPLISCFVVAVLPVERAGQATIAGMVNIAYALALVEHLVLLAVVYGLVVPMVAPRLVVRLIPSISVGLCLGVVLFMWMLFRLGLYQLSSFDYFATIAVRNVAIGTVLDVVIIFLFGFKNNDLRRTCLTR